MKKIIYADASENICRTINMPIEFSVLGGRLLAFFLLNPERFLQNKAEKEKLVMLFHKKNNMVIAPGLLSGSACASADRCTVACRHLESPDRIEYSNAGGSVSSALAYCNIAAVVIAGKIEICGNILQTLIIEKEKVRFESIPYQGKTVTEYFTLLKKICPDSCASIVIGKAGEYGIPMANLSLSGTKSVSHAGSGSGFVLAQSGIHAVLIDNNPSNDKKKKVSPAVRAFAQALLKNSAYSNKKYSEGCANCVLGHKCAETSVVSRGGQLFEKNILNSDSKNLLFSDLKEFTEICDEFGIDTKAMERLIRELPKEKEEYDPEILHRGFTLLKTNPKESLYFKHLITYQNIYKDKTQNESEKLDEIIADSLGLCKFAAEAIRSSSEVRDKLNDVLLNLGSISLDTLTAFAKKCLKTE